MQRERGTYRTRKRLHEYLECRVTNTEHELCFRPFVELTDCVTLLFTLHQKASWKWKRGVMMKKVAFRKGCSTSGEENFRLFAG